MVTGVSGSGKSSLVFDTIYAEGQRRYVESLSAYARQFLERMEKPDVDEIDGLAPPIAIRQKNTTRNPRSTVATATEIYDFLRLLCARAGRTYCPQCGERVERDTVDHVAARMLAEPEGSRWYVLFPVRPPAARRPRRCATGSSSCARGFNRLFQDGRMFEFSTPESLLDIDFTQPLYVLVDRIVMAPDLHQRLVDSVEICYREAGEVVFEQAGAEPRRAPALQREVRLQELRHRVRRPRAAPVQLQQPLRRLPALPGLRQHHRLRPGPRHPRPPRSRSTRARSSPGPSRSTAGPGHH